MRKFHTVAPALIAVLAFSAFLVTSASASEWLENGHAITTAAPATAWGTLTLLDLQNEVEVECEGEGLGTVGPGAADEITAIEALGKGGPKIPCTIIRIGLVKCSIPGVVEYFNLPWVTELKLPRDLIEKHPGGNNPGWKTECLIANIFKIVQRCSFPDPTTSLTNVASGTVDAGFDTTTEEATCNEEAEHRAHVTGTLHISLNSGAALAIS